MRASIAFLLCVGGAALGVVLADADLALACQCVATASGHQPCQDRWTYDAVFVGRVVAIEPASREIEWMPGRTLTASERRVRIEVIEPFSGVPAGEVVVHTGVGGGDCGVAFEPTRAYLIYASRRSDGALSTGICSPTRKIEEAAGDLTYLRSVPVTPGREGRLMGIAARWPAAPGVARTLPVAGVRISAEGLGLRRTAVTDVNGRFEILAPPGRYVVSAEPPAGSSAAAMTLSGNESIELKDARGCAVIDILIKDVTSRRPPR